MQTMSVDIPDEIVGQAEQVAATTGVALASVLATWLHEGCAQTAIQTMAATVNPQVTPQILSPADLKQLVGRLNQPSTALPEEEAIELEELLRSYRQRLVGSAQAITDWLTGKRARDTQRQVAQLTTVTSTMLYAVGYDAASQTLDVVFNTGGIYRYFDVPPHIYRDLLAAESVGQFMWRNVLRLYPVVRLGK